MASFTLSAFADEINPKLDLQIQGIKKRNINHIEIRGIDGKNISDLTSDEVKKIKAQLDLNDVKISSIGSPVGKIKITDPMDDHINMFKNIIESAKILESKYIRLFSFFIPNSEDPNKYRDEVLKRMNMFVQTAKGSGIILLHENEKDIYGDVATRCKDIIESVGSDSLKAVFDPANFVQCGEVTYPYAFDMMYPYIEYMHIKDAKASDSTVVPAGSGDGHVKEILSFLKKNNYNGFLSLEPHLAKFVGLSALEEGHEKEKATADNLDKFLIAVDALNKILSEI